MSISTWIIARDPVGRGRPPAARHTLTTLTSSEGTRSSMSTMLRMKTVIAAPCALALATLTAACGSATAGPAAVPSIFTPDPSYATPHPATSSDSITWPTNTQVRAYLKAHPAPALPGMTAGIRSFNDDSPSKDIRCGGGAHGSAVTVGSPDNCLAWQVTLITATGTLTVTCGNLSAGIPCPSAVYPDRGADPMPDTGDYLYAPSDGQVTASHDMRVIKRDALS